MSYSKQQKIFYLSLVVSLVFRFLSEFLTIEQSTGFLKPGFKVLGYVFGIICVLAAVLSGFVSYKTDDLSENFYDGDILTALSSVAISVFMIFDIFTLENLSIYPSWEIFLIYVSSVLTALFFFVFALKNMFGFNLPGFCYVLPMLYGAVKLIRIFASTSTITLITENTFGVLSACSQMLFFLEFAKIYNGYNGKRDKSSLLAFGNVCAIICLSSSLPIIVSTLFANGTLHESIMSVMTVCATGLLALCFNSYVFENKKN